MIGASVDKGYARTPAAGSTAAAVVDTNNTNGSFVTTTALYNFTTNVTGGGLTTQGSKSGSGAGLAEENGMSTEEIQIRLSYAMSLTFMVGFIQVIIRAMSRANLSSEFFDQLGKTKTGLLAAR